MTTPWTNTLEVPRINLRNNINTDNTSTPLKLNEAKFRHIYEYPGSGAAQLANAADEPLEPTDDDYGKKLPWLSFHKTSNDLLQVRLSTTVAYVQDLSAGTTSTAPYQAFSISGFPLLLQGPSSQFHPSLGATTDGNWEHDWKFYKEYVRDFSGNLENSFGSDDWLNTDTVNSPLVITDMKNKKNLLILDLSSNSAVYSNDESAPNFVLKNTNGSRVHSFGSSTMEKVNRKDRPPYLVIRLDRAIEETTYSSHVNNTDTPRDRGLISTNSNFWQSKDVTGSVSLLPKLRVFNYVYYGYVISPYDFMANFTTDFLRGALAPTSVGGTPDSFFLHTNNQDNIQVNSEFFSPTHELKTGWSNRGGNHFFINTPYYYDVHLCPQLLNYAEPGNSNIITDTTPWSIRNNVITDISFVNLGSCPDISTTTAPYYIEQLFWFSLHSFRHTEYSAPNLNPSITKKLYLGNYLNVNEVETSTSIDSSGNYMYTNTNADYMPKKTSTGFSPCGCIVTDYHKYDTVSGATRYNYEQGTRSLAMPRKTVTPYFKIDNTNLTEYSKYAFNWKDPTKTWDVSGASGITSNTTYIDVSNCEVIEWRNLVEFDSNTIFHLDIDISRSSNSTATSSVNTKRYITLVTSDNPKTDYWKNNVQLGNNDVITMDTDSSGAKDPRNIKNIYSEKFRITWGDDTSSTIAANTSKYAYVIDIANGKQVIKATDMGWTTEKVNTSISLDGFLPPSNSDYEFKSTSVEYTLGGNPGGTEVNGTEYLWRNLGAGGGWSVNVLKIGVDASNDWGTTISDIEYSPLLDRINFPLDSEESTITMNINREKTEETQPFGYLNFIGLTSSEFLGGINARDLNSNSNIILSKMFKRRNIETNSLRRAITINPYFKNDTDSSDSYWKDNSVKKIFYNPNLFYGHTNFKHSNVYGAAISTFSDSQTDIFFKNGVQNPPTWRSGSYKNDGKEITTLPQLGYIRPSGIDLYTSSLTGKFDLNNRVFDGPINEDDEAPTIELNDKITLSEVSVGIVNQKFECLNFYNIMHTMSQKNLFISDHWEWKQFLTELIEPPSVYTGPVPITIIMPDKTINKRYNVYNYKATNVPSSVYTTGIHTPDRAYENQCLISMIIEVSTVSLNVSHILLNTWHGNKTETNEFPMVGLSSFPNENGEYESIYGTPILNINGGKSITPSISTNPVYFSISPTGHFNFATDSTPGNISVNDKSKAPREITEIEGGSAIDFKLSSFGNLADHHNVVSGGWFTHQSSSTYPTSSNNGIFSNTIPVSTSITSSGASTIQIPVYNTIDISTNALAEAPTNITTTFTGKFTQESQKFPLELFFTYPFTMDSSIAQPNRIDTIYNNSDEETITHSFTDYKGYKRFSSLYALEIMGSPFSYNNPNFWKEATGTYGVIPAQGRKIFPNTVILNCVELPPPLQINNFNDMLAGDNSFTRIVWKGYNFDYSPDGPREQNGNVGDIVWKIERFQTQLEIRKVVFEGTIIPDGGENVNGYNLSKYIFIDKDVRIYDKYRYTVSGIYRYQFKRTRSDPKLYTLELDIGSFTTDEFIICKNNKFEYGRYNTGATNLKLFRPLLINKKGGQVDAFNRPSAGGLCIGNIFSGSTRISSSQNIYANTSNQVTKKGTYVLLSKQQYRPFR